MRDATPGLRGRGVRAGAHRLVAVTACLSVAVLPAACSGSSSGTAAGSPTAAPSAGTSPGSGSPDRAPTAGSAPSALDSAGNPAGSSRPAPTKPVAGGRTLAPGSALAARPTAPAPTSRGVQEAIAKALADPELHGRLGVAVVDPRTGRLLYGFGQASSFTPASTMKLFTATAAVDLLGAGTRFTTRVVKISPAGAPVSVVLVGGGDISLARAPVAAGQPPARGATPGAADIATLAARTVAALGPVRAVRLAYDASLFTGPATSAQWIPSYLVTGQVSPVSALTVDAGRVGPGRRQRSTAPATAAVQAFAQALDARGVKVAVLPTPVRAPAAAPTVAAVQSPPVAGLVAHLLTESDNDYGESMFRHIALASGQPGDFGGGIRAVVADLRRRGIDPRTTRVLDGSGLSRQDRTTPLAMAAVLVAAVREPALRSVADSIAVAGVSGTVRDGFTGAAAAGRLRVRAKTGTLAGVSALAGTVSTPSAGELVFVFLTDTLPTTYPNGPRSALELAAARLAQCGCHTPG